ncbi:hypothetical protein H5T55_03550 [Candidatus Bipolaricaulota bacterium]|nr:hypothetical protein [Candidatus Bipolaricaulota bacterium]
MREFSSGVLRSYSAAFSPDGKYFAVGRQDATIRVWNTATGAEARVLTGQAAACSG